MPPTSTRPLLAYGLLTTSALMWGGNFTVGRYIHSQIAPGTLNLLRWSLVVLILLPFTFRALHRQRELLFRHWRFIAALGVTGITLFHTFVYSALNWTGAVNATLIFTTIPMFIVAMSWVLFREPASMRQFFGIVASMFGALVVITRGDLGLVLTLEFNRGDLLMLIAVPNWALYSVLLRHRPAEIEPLVLVMSTGIAGLICQVPIALWEVANQGWPALTTPVALSVGYVAVFAGVVAYLCWNRGVAEVGANRAGLFLNLVPLFGALLAVVFLGESIYAFHWVGAALVGAGIYLSSSRTALKSSRPQSP